MLFDIQGQKLVLIVEHLSIPEFREIYETASSPKEAENKLLFIYHMSHPKSPYANLSEEDRYKRVYADYLKGIKMDAKLSKAMEKYKMLIKTPSIRYLEGVEMQIDKLGKFLSVTEPTEKNIYAVLKAITEGADILTAYGTLKERVDKELSAKKDIKKNITPNIFEEEA
jgi:hypothetical protein